MVTCPHCSHTIGGEHTLAGTELCPKCDTRFTVSAAAKTIDGKLENGTHEETVGPASVSDQTVEQNYTPADSSASGETVVSPHKPAEVDESTITIGDYEILCKLAQGGMGVIYKARDTRIDRDVAVKVIRQRGTQRIEQGQRLRFVEEAQVTGQLEHPGIIPIHTLGSDGDNDYFMPKGLGVNGEEFEMYIYDRWGDQIDKVTGVWSDDPSIGWDGHANEGKKVAQNDVYVWLIRTEDFRGESHEYIGHVTLLR